jgi:mRNA interferase HicA
MKREGGSHSIWRNPATNEIQAIPRHNEIGENLARKICRKLSIPDPS